MTNKYINIKDVSKILGVSKGTLRNWDKSGKLKPNRHPINNYRVYKMQDVEKILELMEIAPNIIKRKKDEIKKINIRHLENEE